MVRNPLSHQEAGTKPAFLQLEVSTQHVQLEALEASTKVLFGDSQEQVSTVSDQLGFWPLAPVSIWACVLQGAA